MPNPVVRVKLMGGPMNGSVHQAYRKDYKRSNTMEIRSMGRILKYRLGHRPEDEDDWDAVYVTPQIPIIGREDGIGGFGGNTLDY